MLSEKPWKPDAVLLLFLGIMVSISFGALAVYGFQAAGWGGKAQPGLLFLIKTLSFQGMALYLIYGFARAHDLSWANAFGFNHPPIGRAALLAAVVGAAAIPIAWSLNSLSEKILTAVHVQAELQPAVQALKSAGSGLEVVYFGLVAVILAPLVEELLFRGILYPFLKRASHRKLALWGTSFLFAAIHANLVTFIPLTFLAVIFTLLYETTGNLLSPILAHSLFNAMNFFYLLQQLNLGRA